MGMGQLWTIAETLGCLRPSECDRHTIESRFLSDMQWHLFNRTLNAADGICSPEVPDAAKIAYDLQCVIRALIAKRDNHPTSSVWHGSPLHTCRAEPLATAR